MILVIDAGFLSIKILIFQSALTKVMASQISRIGGLIAHVALGNGDKNNVTANHKTGLNTALASLTPQEITACKLTAINEERQVAVHAITLEAR